MPRTKSLNIVVQFGHTNLVVNDLGLGHDPRYELYNTAEKKTIRKSSNPLDFDDYVEKIWKEMPDV